MLPVPEYQIYENVKEYIKYYPNFSKLITYKETVQMRIPGYELNDDKNIFKNNKNILYSPQTSTQIINSSKEESINRTKKTLTDLVLCNDFSLFATFTFKDNRQNITLNRKRMAKWLKNQREIHGKFNYLIVSEFHKDRESIHFHALLENYKGTLKDTHILQNGRRIKNITSYHLGHSTAVVIDNQQAVSRYIRKYITKDMIAFPNQQRYWCSDGLIRPILQRNPQLTTDQRRTFAQVFESPYFTLSKSSEILQPQY